MFVLDYIDVWWEWGITGGYRCYGYRRFSVRIIIGRSSLFLVVGGWFSFGSWRWVGGVVVFFVWGLGRVVLGYCLEEAGVLSVLMLLLFSFCCVVYLGLMVFY